MKMKLPPTRNLIATAVAVLIAAPFLLMYARWRGIWLWPALVFLAIAAAWRLRMFPKSGYIALVCCGIGIFAGIGLGFLASLPLISSLQSIKIRPGIVKMVCMFHGGWIGLLFGLFVGYYMHLKRLMNRPAASAVSLPPAQPPRVWKSV